MAWKNKKRAILATSIIVSFWAIVGYAVVYKMGIHW